MVDMSDDDWPYDELGFPRRVHLDIDWFLRGAGFGGGDDPFTEDDLRERLGVDFIEVDEVGRVVVTTAVEDCGCNPRAMANGAQSLMHFLSARPSGFPRSEQSIEALRLLTHENQEWRKWIDPLRSVPADETGSGSICLWGCPKDGHHCSVHIGSDGTYSIGGLVAATLGIAADEFGNETEHNEQADDETLFDDPNYDRRTFGDLDDSEPNGIVDQGEDPSEVWLDSGYGAVDVRIFIENGIHPRDAEELAQVMPAGEISKWVKRFKSDWRIALDIYLAALGQPHDSPISDSGRDGLAEAIRMSVHSALRRMLRTDGGPADHG
jgi:hypothetical protein